MSNPVVRAFFIGRATADLLRERMENTLTDLASEFGKTLLEWQEGWQTFAFDVIQRAEQEEALAVGDPTQQPLKTDDLQATLDDLRAEVAQLRSELRKYRSQST
ncbi:MAG: hypothetical protein NW237_10015 [Cyanobacteriota bacterium]|nr:hypothetical protein [Cyanobacteriota bacterium]